MQSESLSIQIAKHISPRCMLVLHRLSKFTFKPCCVGERLNSTEGKCVGKYTPQKQLTPSVSLVLFLTRIFCPFLDVYFIHFHFTLMNLIMLSLSCQYRQGPSDIRLNQNGFINKQYANVLFKHMSIYYLSLSREHISVRPTRH